MKSEKEERQIAYICTGKDRTCEKSGCYYRNRGPCMHTLNSRYAKNRVVDDPEKHPERFESFKANLGGRIVTRYYERSDRQ